ncbi:MAG: hypothetical protein QOJ85_2346 [Solirubrobacteraceae bacterium]|jgi:hypothetical protein|nr:hypothetical protein [Solirubrobacteraceae bacterium]
MSDETGGARGRFSGLSGVLAGSAAAITAVGGLIAVLAQVGVFGGGHDVTTVTAPPVAGSSASATEPTVVAVRANDDWAARANDICAKANDDIASLPDPESLDPADLGGMAAAGREVVDISRRQLRQLQKLTPPQDDAPKVKRLLRIYAEQNQALEDFVGGLRIDAIAGRNSGGIDIAKIQAQQENLKRLGASSDNLAKQLGATTCAEGSSFSGTTFPGG